MRDKELKRMRDEALYDAYVEGVKSGQISSLQEAAAYAVNHQAPEFFISAKRVSVLFGLIEAGKEVVLNACSWRRIRQLHNNYTIWMAEHPACTMSREMILEMLVDEPAPEFYMEVETARRIIQRVAVERREKKIKELMR